MEDRERERERDALGKRSRENSPYLSLSTNIMCVLMWRRKVWESLKSLKRDGIEEMDREEMAQRGEGRERRLLDDSFPLERKHSLTIHEARTQTTGWRRDVRESKLSSQQVYKLKA